MLEETASVVSVEGSLAKVSLTRSEACGSCSAKNMCHPTGEKSMEMDVLNSAGAHPGDRVVISLPPAELLKASAAAYMVPAVAAGPTEFLVAYRGIYPSGGSNYDHIFGRFLVKMSDVFLPSLIIQ